ncbi:MAG: phosphoribosylanthranilate isomerase [Alphaproteobacteria bacterium]|nr:MAG: phosphoribosylanthranilate isomerase [Alphaproteobacteria bacterium]
MLTQVYEVSSPPEADAVSSLGVDHVGVLVGNGIFPRERSMREATAILSAIRTPSKSLALFLSADLALIERTARELRPAIIHLGASTELLWPKHVIDLRKALPNVLLMRSVPVTVGVTHDWNISRSIVENVQTPVILAGGLGPDNVADAIVAVRPAGVDSKTQTDLGSTHTKDLAKVAAFNKAAKGVIC